MCQRPPIAPGRGRRFPSRRFPSDGLTVPALRPLSIPSPRPTQPPKLVPDYDGEPADHAQAAP